MLSIGIFILLVAMFLASMGSINEEKDGVQK